jgi:uncharacterized protein YjbI with pentapeptide repeats
LKLNQLTRRTMKVIKADTPNDLERSKLDDFSNENTIERKSFHKLDFSNFRQESIDLVESEINSCLFIGAKLIRFGAKDVRIIDSQLVAADLSDGGMLRTEFSGSRMNGIDLSRSSLKDVIFRNCKLDMGNFRYTKMKRVAFVDCSLQDTDFIHAELDEVRFQNCQIERTNFSNITAKKVDLSGSKIIELIGWKDLRNFTIDSLQLVELAPQIVSALGINVKFE